ncbi:MAG TPA: NifU family protein [Bacteroidia bacterium]|jgi:Fe-S cluster biogenesis protein NfuA|nr:NifU family protein [Bacteroidia bacterium]
MEPLLKKPVIVYAESTPNPASMKFVANQVLLEDGATAQYLNAGQTKGSALARQLFQFPFIQGVFISGNYITLTKSEAVSWDDVTLELREFLKTFLASGEAVVSEVPKAEVHTDNTFEKTTTVFTEHTAPQTEAEHKIVEILEQYIRPAVEQDGGLITFRSFAEGIVTVQLKGACSGCPSSTMTLKAGIEGLLKRLVPGVTEVVAEAV